MSLIIGIENCKVDTNGRFKFPNALKKQLETEDVRFVVRKSDYAQCLELWSYTSFISEVEKLRLQLNPYSKDDLKLLRRLTAGNIVEMDSNDRLLLPPEQKPHLNNAKDVVLEGVGDHVEIWSREQYDQMNGEATDFASLADKRLGHIAPAAVANLDEKLKPGE